MKYSLIKSQSQVFMVIVKTYKERNLYLQNIGLLGHTKENTNKGLIKKSLENMKYR